MKLHLSDLRKMNDEDFALLLFHTFDGKYFIQDEKDKEQFMLMMLTKREWAMNSARCMESLQWVHDQMKKGRVFLRKTKPWHGFNE